MTVKRLAWQGLVQISGIDGPEDCVGRTRRSSAVLLHPPETPLSITLSAHCFAAAVAISFVG